MKECTNGHAWDNGDELCNRCNGVDITAKSRANIEALEGEQAPIIEPTPEPEITPEAAPEAPEHEQKPDDEAIADNDPVAAASSAESEVTPEEPAPEASPEGESEVK